jgi:hypothetical protein
VASKGRQFSAVDDGLGVSRWNRDAVHPSSHAITLRTNIGQNAPYGGSAEDDDDGQDDHELRYFRCALISKHEKQISFLT